MEPHEFPYEYGSDLHWLWGWAQRIDDSEALVTGPNHFAGMYFRPDRLAANAIQAFTAKYGPIVRQIQDYLDHAERLFSDFLKCQNEGTWQDFCIAAGDLADRIFHACKVISADVEKPTSKASKQDHDRLAFWNQHKSKDLRVTQEAAADLWNKQERDFCDLGAFKQSLYRARQDIKNAEK